MNRFSLFIITFIVCSTGIVGCATLKDYKEPNSEPIAKLTFVAGVGAHAAVIHQQADSNCNLLNGIASISENPNQGIVIGGYPRVKEKSINISAESSFRFQISDLHPNALGIAYCGVASEFKPMAGFEYKVIWSFPAMSCGMELLEKMPDGAWHSKELTRIESCKNY